MSLERRTAAERKGDLGAVAAVAGLYALLEGLGVTCPIRALTGVSCAGCGMSRAWLSLLRLDLASAFRYHPLFLFPVPAALLLLFRSRLDRNLFRLGLGALCAAFVIVYFVRLFTPGDPVVVWEPAQGLLINPRRIRGQSRIRYHPRRPKATPPSG